MTPTPSTLWSEQIAADEETRFADYARQFAELQRLKSAKLAQAHGGTGKGRALHRKAHLALEAELEVLPNLPAHAAHGLFAQPGRFATWLRLSNGSGAVQGDRVPDVRGFALQVRGVSGPGALGGQTDSQDFLLINHPAFSFPKSDEFVGVALHAAQGPLALLKYLIGRYGFFAGLALAKKLQAGIGKPFSGFATETFWSAAPIACGPYAAKLRLVPDARSNATQPPPSWADDVTTRLAQGPLSFTLQLQFFVDEATTPIENAAVEWPEESAPFVDVARLTAGQQDPASAAGQALTAQVEAAQFDPWHALAAHRPLGDIMRARKVVYYASQQGRV